MRLLLFICRPRNPHGFVSIFQLLLQEGWAYSTCEECRLFPVGVRSSQKGLRLTLKKISVWKSFEELLLYHAICVMSIAAKNKPEKSQDLLKWHPRRSMYAIFYKSVNCTARMLEIGKVFKSHCFVHVVCWWESLLHVAIETSKSLFPVVTATVIRIDGYERLHTGWFGGYHAMLRHISVLRRVELSYFEL